MDGRDSTQQIDALLLPFLRVGDEAESQRLLARLVSGQAEPIIKNIIRYKLRVYLGGLDRTRQSQDAEDVYGDVILQLLGRLHDLKTNPGSAYISNFRSYVAVITYHACHEYLRQKYPQRHSLKNKLRYLLTHQHGLALWESDNKQSFCGFAVWRDKGKTPARAGRTEQLRADPRLLEREAAAGLDLQRLSPADLLAAVFAWVREPVELDDLVDIVASLQGIKDRAEQTEGDDQDCDPLPESLPDPRASVATEMDQRSYLARLWAEICELPPRQRAALLLNLRDGQGSSSIEMFPITGIATIRQIAEALGLPAEKLAAIWNDLPLDDATIAGHLEVTRQQVINLRKSARDRLARRMRAFDEGK
jgi:RNA polymerase sigma factor (sigma-70 family)